MSATQHIHFVIYDLANLLQRVQSHPFEQYNPSSSTIHNHVRDILQFVFAMRLVHLLAIMIMFGVGFVNDFSKEV
jgi:hypothetical protein